VLPLGDPGVPLGTALDRVRGWYEERGLTPLVQVVGSDSGAGGEELSAELAARGWRGEAPTGVWTGALAPLGDLDADVSAVRVGRDLDEGWLRRYHRAGGTPGTAEEHVLRSGPSVWFADVGEAAGVPPGEDVPRGAPAAIGRCVVDGRWAGFMAIEVDPARRRRGLARAVMAALARRALDEGASAAWLQVEDDNVAAGALYAGLGFTVHHGYRYFRPA
jgi:ribosomal protein S18 acetylase RimI-like enzyme